MCMVDCTQPYSVIVYMAKEDIYGLTFIILFSLVQHMEAASLRQQLHNLRQNHRHDHHPTYNK
jgi:hypothetical protein